MKDNTKTTSNQWINSSDFEREFLKDYVYLQEESHELDKQLQEEINKFRKPAAIFIVDTDKILERDEVRHNVLPF